MDHYHHEGTETDMQDELSRLENSLTGKMKHIRKTLANGGNTSPVVNSLSWMNIARFPTSNLQAMMDSRWNDIEKRIQMIADSCREIKTEHLASVAKAMEQFPSIDQRLSQLEARLSEVQSRFEEIKRVEGDIKEARQKQYETFMDDRGKLRVDYLDLKQEVTQKLKVMQMRLEDLLSANAAAALASAQAPEAPQAAAFAPESAPAEPSFMPVDHLSAFGLPEEKSAFQRFIDWWNEPVLSISKTKDAGKNGDSAIS